MTEPMDRVEDQALRLSVRERAHLARLLLESLDEAEDPAGVAEAWEAEIERRVADFQSGKSTPVASATVFREARAQIRKK